MKRMMAILYSSIGFVVVSGVIAGVIAFKEEGFTWGMLAVIGGSTLVAALVIIPIIRTFRSQEVKNGVQAEATVLKMWDTGTTINDDPLVGFLLEVQPLGLPAYQVETKTLVSRLSVANVQPGMGATVKYDPQNIKRVAVETFHVEQATPERVAATSDRMEELEELRTRKLITEEEYSQKRGEILKTL
jgi:hypothetical protein